MKDSHAFSKDLTRPGSPWSIDLELTPEEYAAIGRVSAQWAFLEYHITAFCTFLAEQSGQGVTADFASDSFRKRKRAWQALVELTIAEGSPERASMDAIIRETGALQGERQTAVHSFFEWDTSNPSQLSGRSHKNPGGRPRKHSAKSIEAIADKIATLNAKFISWPGSEPELVPVASFRHTPR